jgi:hypothetical protein
MHTQALTEPAQTQLVSSFPDPVFVLCNGRSGSTLLRFLLDAHPDLACPPETNVPSLCAHLATVWSLIEGAPLGVSREDGPPEIPDAAIGGIRATMERMIGSYLERRGKKRYCDKSLGTAQYVELLARVYPGARFICLYRHPMDVIASGMEACPWGLSGFGFDPYIAMTPGNSVLALARFWIDNAFMTLSAEEKYPDRCIRVRYEDLVTNPETTAAKVFEFLGVAPEPGISATCFSAERERYGPGDQKIWFTSSISADSIGRGWSIPAGLIGPQVLAGMQELTGKLGYVPVDGTWGSAAPPADLRLPVDPEPGDPAAAGSQEVAAVPRAASAGEPAHSRALGDRLLASLTRANGTADRWAPHDTETVVAVTIPPDPRQPAEHWLVDLKNRTVTFTDGSAQEHSDWDVIGSADAWERVISGQLNLSIALRSARLRYCDNDEDDRPLAGEARTRILADLLGLTTW